MDLQPQGSGFSFTARYLAFYYDLGSMKALRVYFGKWKLKISLRVYRGDKSRCDSNIHSKTPEKERGLPKHLPQISYELFK